MDPINYITGVQNPIEAMIEGYGRRLAQQNEERQMGQTDAQLGMQQQQIDLQAQQQAFARQQVEAQAAAEAAQKAQMEAGQQAYVDYILDPNKTLQKTADTIRANPQIAEQVMAEWGAMSAGQQAGTKDFAMQLTYALGNGNDDLAKEMLQSRITAAENSGNKQEADTYKAYLDTLSQGDQGKQAVLGSVMAGLYPVLGPDEMKKHAEMVFGKQATLEDEKTMAEIAKIRSETTKIVMETVADPAALTPDEVMTAEAKLRAEYLKNTGDFVLVQDAYRRLSSSQDSAVGDVALIFAYMKMLDPGSVVREGEFANAQNTGSIPTQIWNVYNKAISGERLAPEQRLSFRSQAEDLYSAAQKREAEIRKGLKLTVDEFGLSEDRIFVGAPGQVDEEAMMTAIEAKIAAGQQLTSEELQFMQGAAGQ